MKVAATPREVKGVEYPDPVAYVVAGGFTEAEARAVINAYKRFYSLGMQCKACWQDYVTANTQVKDKVKATAIMRRYREFYGK